MANKTWEQYFQEEQHSEDMNDLACGISGCGSDSCPVCNPEELEVGRNLGFSVREGHKV